MGVMRRLISLVFPALLAACGGQLTSSRNAVSAQQALTQTAEFLEFESAPTRTELFRDVARASVAQAGHTGPVMFPVVREGGELVAAPGISPSTDLLMSADAGAGLQL